MGRVMEPATMIRPTDAQTYIDASWYKIGRHNLAFVHTNGEWRRSGKSAGAIFWAIELDEILALKAADDRQGDLDLSTQLST